MNTYESQGFLKKNAVWSVVLIAILIFGTLLYTGWDKVVNDKVDNMTTVTGNFSCLLLKGGAPQEGDCTLGVRSSDGSYGALDVRRIQDANTDLKVEDTIAVTGFLLDETQVIGSEWERFEVKGIIKVNTLLRTR